MSMSRGATIPSLSKSTGRVEPKADKYKNDVQYYPNLDYVKPNIYSQVPDFNRFIKRKSILNHTYDVYSDNTLVQQGYKSLSHARKMHEPIKFD